MSLLRRAAIALVAGAIIVGGAMPAAAAAAGRKTTRTTLRASRHAVLQRDPVVLTGRAGGSRLALYRQIGKRRWTRAQSVPVRAGHYRATAHPAAGKTTHYRAGRNGPVTTITSTACAPLSHHFGVQMWPNDLNEVTTLPTRWTQLICSAAPGSTIRFSAMWIYDDDAVMDRMIAALRDVHRLRGVDVQLFVRRSSYGAAASTNAPTWWAFTHKIAPFAQVDWCMYSCANDVAGAHMHVKAITISKTIFGASADAETGANFSHEQLARQRQSAVYVYGNQTLTDAFVANWNAMLGHVPTGLSVWAPVGGGIAVTFDPQSLADDPVATELTTLACQPGDTVEVINATVTRSTVVQQLDRLADSGCAVRVLYETTTPKTDANVVVAHLRLHDKIVVIHAHRPSGSTVNEVLCGSEDLMAPSLLLSNQQLFRIRVANIVTAYDGWFDRLWQEADSPAE